MQADDADVQARIDARIEQITRERGWPWQQPGAVSVSLDDDGQIVEGVADEDGNLIVTRVLGPPGGDSVVS